MAGRLRQDRRVRGTAASARAAAAAVEDRQLDIAVARDLDEPFLRAVDRPLGPEEAAVLPGVGIADHHLEAAIAIPQPLREARLVDQLADDVRSSLEVRDRLEQWNDRKRLVAEVEDGEDVCGGCRAGDDHGVERFRPVPSSDLGGRGQRRPHPFA